MSHPDPHDPYAALRIPSVRFFLISSIAAVIGGQIQAVAIAWEVYERTNSAYSLALIGALRALPVLLLGLPAGQLADIYDRRKLLMLSQAASMFTAVALIYVSYYHMPVEWMYLLVFLRASAFALGMPARGAILPLIVKGPAFSNAVSWSSTAFELALMSGPAIGGFIIGWKMHAAYAVDAGCMLVAIAAASQLKFEQVPSRNKPSLEGMVAGARFVWNKKLILSAISLDLFAVLLMPIYARDILKVGETGMGWLRAAPALGAMTMALIQAHRPPMQRAGRTLLFAVAGYGACIVVFGISTNFWLSMLALIFSGMCDNISVVVRHTLVQGLTPDSLRGRVSAVNSMFIGCSNQLSEFKSGSVAGYFGALFTPIAGAVISAASGGLGTIAIVATIAYLCPQLRALGSLNDIKPEKEETVDDPKENSVSAAK
jgi:MFS family permease